MNEDFFKKWIQSYPQSLEREFHRDGVIDKDIFAKEKWKLLFVVKEPNSKNGNYDKYLGADLRDVWGATEGEKALKKPFNRNVARWTKIICDGVGSDHSLNWQDVAETMRRVAIINLKKMAGSGSENREEVCLYSFKDKGFIKEQISEINPNVILACGKDGFVFRMIWRIMNDEICFPSDIGKSFYLSLHGKAVPVFSVYHPSLRLKRQEDQAANEIVEIQRKLKSM
ncbi:MAG: hypothetical protein ABL891_20255 [Burkholderiales bacterium]